MELNILVAVVLIVYKVNKKVREVKYEDMVYSYNLEVKEKYSEYLSRRLYELERYSSMTGISYGFYNNETILKNFKLRLDNRKVKSRYNLKMNMR